jgi:hypothetical protein
MMLRSIPSKTENGPAAEMRAMLTRQPKSANPEPSGQQAISEVLPPPFFHGIAGSKSR